MYCLTACGRTSPWLCEFLFLFLALRNQDVHAALFAHSSCGFRNPNGVDVDMLQLANVKYLLSFCPDGHDFAGLATCGIAAPTGFSCSIVAMLLRAAPNS